MNQVLPIPMTVDQFLRWSARQDSGRYELHKGHILKMPAESLGHVLIKDLVTDALKAAIQRANLPFRALPEGVAVRVSDDNAFEPDALVVPLPLPAASSREIPNPILVVEVLSASTSRRDLTTKVAGYARVPSIEHYIVVDPADRVVLHYRRQGEIFAPPVEVTEGTLRLDPPGLDLPLADMLGPAPETAAETA